MQHFKTCDHFLNDLKYHKRSIQGHGGIMPNLGDSKRGLKSDGAQSQGKMTKVLIMKSF